MIAWLGTRSRSRGNAGHRVRGVVERHSQVPFRTADREQVTSVPSCRIGSRKSAARHRRRYNQPFLQHEPTGNHSRHRATGYIGGRLAPRLLEEGRRVRVLARNAARVRSRSIPVKARPRGKSPGVLSFLRCGTGSSLRMPQAKRSRGEALHRPGGRRPVSGHRWPDRRRHDRSPACCPRHGPSGSARSRECAPSCHRA